MSDKYDVQDDRVVIKFGNIKPFYFVDYIRPVENEDGTIMTYGPQTSHERTEYNKNCKSETEFVVFKIKDLPKVNGVYIWVDGKDISYIGETKNFRDRFSYKGYGKIYSYNCLKSGQSTNCKMNHEILNMYRNGKFFRLYFQETENYKKLEKELIETIQPRLNVKDNPESND